MVSNVLGMATLAYFDFLWVLAAGWLLSGGLAAGVTATAVLLTLVPGLAGASPPGYVLSQLLLLPAIALAGRWGSVNVLRSAESAAMARRLRRDSERIAELENAKSEFLRLAAHELRGPVAVLRGYVSLLADGSLGRLPEPAAHALPILNGKLREVNLMVDQMLDTARMEDNRLQLTMRRQDLRGLLRESVESITHLATPAHRIVVDIDRRPAVAVVDRGRIAIVLTNLIQNAIKYSPDGGEIRCRLRAEAATAAIAITDSGIGVAAADLPRLFTRYGRVASDSHGIPGTGLGLYLSRELARRHGGDILVETSPGSGSTFTLRLPLAPDGAPPEPEDGRRPGGSITPR